MAYYPAIRNQNEPPCFSTWLRFSCCQIGAIVAANAGSSAMKKLGKRVSYFVGLANK